MEEKKKTKMTNPNSTEKIIEAKIKEFRKDFGGLVNFDNEADDWFYPELEAFLTKSLNEVAESAKEEEQKRVEKIVIDVAHELRWEFLTRADIAVNKMEKVLIKRLKSKPEGGRE